MERIFVIETQDSSGQWCDDMVGDANEFATRDEAEAMIPELRKLGDDWLDAEYRVVERERE